MTPFIFNTTPSIVFGPGRSNELAQLANKLGSHVLVVTDPGLVKAGLVAPVVASLENNGLVVTLFDEVVADPPEALVLQATEAARRAQATGIIGLGGGSSLDVAKLVSVLSNDTVDIAEIYGIGNIRGGRLPLVLIPTTAGTGSEVTPISIITTGAHEKKGVVSPVLLPDVAVLDPELTLGLPPAVTAATGVDAMVHAIEAYASANANNNPLSRGMALQALELLFGNIREAVHQGSNRDARSAMLLGSLLAGQAFANSPVAAVHALAYPLGGHFGVSHGLSNALMLPHVLRFNIETHPAIYAELATKVLPGIDHLTATEQAAHFIQYLEQLMRDVRLQTQLRELSIPREACRLLAEDAMKQTRLLVNNPRPVTQDDALRIYEAAW